MGFCVVLTVTIIITLILTATIVRDGVLGRRIK